MSIVKADVASGANERRRSVEPLSRLRLTAVAALETFRFQWNLRRGPVARLAHVVGVPGIEVEQTELPPDAATIWPCASHQAESSADESSWMPSCLKGQQ